MGVPGQVAFEAVLDVGGEAELVVFVGVDDQFGCATEAFQGLVHLLAAEDRYVPIDIAAHEEGGGGDFGDVAER